MIGVRVVAFGTVEPALWGVAWIPDGHVAAPIAVGAPNATAVLKGALAGERPDTDWTLEGKDISLVVSPVGTPRHTADRGGHVESEGAICGVKGQFSLEGARHEVSSPGWRAVIRSDVEIDQLDSLRAVAGWIGRDEGVALIALRRRKSRGQEADMVLAGVLESAEARAVVDPRLSTTYSASGAPARTGLELWFEEASSEDAEDAEPQYPRRAAGEAVGTEIEWDVAGLTLRAHLLRWHTQDRDGAGVYLLGRRR
jgi:hypothetical protein